jgi:hypothetical protein
MPKPQRIGVPNEPRGGSQCGACGTPFESNELIDFLFMTRGNTLRCISCDKENYIIGRGGFISFLLKLAAIVTTLFFGLLFGLFIPLSSYNPDTGSFYVSPLAFILGVGIGIVVSRLALKTFHWFYGKASIDPVDQSILDFGK